MATPVQTSWRMQVQKCTRPDRILKKVKEQKELAKKYQRSLVKIVREHDEAVKEFDLAVEVCAEDVPPPIRVEAGRFAQRNRKRPATRIAANEHVRNGRARVLS